MAKLLGIVGSPRRHGNTHVLVDAVLGSARDVGAQTEIVLLSDLMISECDGCHACWNGHQCPKDDGMNALYPKLAESSVIVFGTPVYWYGPTALMKAFIDRFVYFNCPENREKIRGKIAAVVVPFEEENPDTVAPVITFFENCFRYLEITLAERLIAPGVTRRGEVRDKPGVLTQAVELGARLAREQATGSW